MSSYPIKLKLIGKKGSELQSWLMGYSHTPPTKKRTNIRYIRNMDEFLISINDYNPDIIINTEPTLNVQYNQHIQLYILLDQTVSLIDVPDLLTHIFNIFPTFYHKRQNGY